MISLSAFVRLTALATAAFLGFAAAASTAEAGDQVRFKITNNAGFVITKIMMVSDQYPDTANPMDTRNRNLALGQSGNVKYDVADSQNLKNVAWKWEGEGAGDTSTCSKKVSVTVEGDQIEAVTKPNGEGYSADLTPFFDQIVVFRFDIIGPIGAWKCRFKAMNVQDR